MHNGSVISVFETPDDIARKLANPPWETVGSGCAAPLVLKGGLMKAIIYFGDVCCLHFSEINGGEKPEIEREQSKKRPAMSRAILF